MYEVKKHMLKNYKDIQGILIKKYRNIVGQYIFVFEENRADAKVRTKICVGKMLYTKAELGTKWTIGHIGRKLINICPGFCKNTEE